MSSDSNQRTLPPEALGSGTELAARLPARAFIPFLGAGITLPFAYGSSFLLADTLRSAGYAPAGAGTIIGVGTIATIIGSLFAGRVAARIGLMPLLAVAALLMSGAMLCFAMIGPGFIGAGYAGGLLLGLGWSVFYILAPVQLIQCLMPSARMEALTLLSGSQMIGLGFSAPVGHFVSAWLGGPSSVYLLYAVLCLVGTGFLLIARRPLEQAPQMPMATLGLTFPQVFRILGSGAAVPILMVGLGACVFSGITTFQTLYAESRNLRPETFFLVFTATAVILRFSVAPLIGRISLSGLALVLPGLILAGLVVFFLNTGSLTLHLAGIVVFSIGYGLIYATLNAMAVNFAGTRGLSIAVASQVFTLGYFVGLFGFPYIAGGLIRGFGIDAVLIAMMVAIVLNMGCALAVKLIPLR